MGQEVKACSLLCSTNTFTCQNVSVFLHVQQCLNVDRGSFFVGGSCLLRDAKPEAVMGLEMSPQSSDYRLQRGGEELSAMQTKVQTEQK